MMSKFDFFEIVKVRSEKADLKAFNHKDCVILGKSHMEDGSNETLYSVNFLDHNNETYLRKIISENDLVRTGKQAKREDFYPGDSIKVHVDPETGEGTIVEYNKNPLNKDSD